MTIFHFLPKSTSTSVSLAASTQALFTLSSPRSPELPEQPEQHPLLTCVFDIPRVSPISLDDGLAPFHIVFVKF